MASCKLYRNSTTIDKVLAANGEDSKLYNGLRNYLQDKDLDEIVSQVPYLQDRLDDNTLLKKSVPEIAAGLWSIAYTPEYQAYISDIPGVLDKNGEPYVEAFLNHLINEYKYTKPQVLSDENVAHLNRVKGTANEIQRRIIDDLHLDPENPIVFNEKAHTYHDLAGNEYFGITKAIGSEYKGDSMYGEAGSKVDKILQVIVENGSYEDIAGVQIGEELKRQIWDNLQVKVGEWTADGSVVISQVMVADKQAKRASAIDILVISPEGHLSVVDLKTGVKSHLSPAYRTEWEVGKGSAFKDQQLSLYDKHGIQVNTYRKYLEMKGYEVIKASTFHMRTSFDGGILIDVGMATQNEVEHPWGENAPLVEKILPGEVPEPYKLREILDELGPDYVIPETVTSTEEANKTLDDVFMEPLSEVLSSLEARDKLLRELRDTRNADQSYIVSDKTLEDLSDLIVKITAVQNRADNARGEAAKANSKKETADAYRDYLTYSLRSAEAILKYLDNDKNKVDPRYIDFIANAEDVIRFHKNTIPRQNLGSETMVALAANLVDKLDDASVQLKITRDEYALNLIADKYGEKSSKEAIELALRDDISVQDMWLGSTDLNKNPALVTMAKTRSAAITDALDAVAVFKANIREFSNKFLKVRGLTKAIKGMYDFMTNPDGTYVSRLGTTYKQLRDKAFALTKSADGEQMQYIVNPVDQEQRDYNIALYRKKQEQRKFWEAETQDDNGFTEGEFHKYSEKFTAAREEHERAIPVTDWNGNLLFWKWSRRKEVTDEQWEQYRREYFDRKEVYKMIKDNGVPTGELEQEPVMEYFPKREYVEIRDISSNGIDLRDQKYVKLMNPGTPEEQANSEFYKQFMESYQTLLDKLPLEVARSMQYKAPRVRNEQDMMRNLKQGLTSFFTLRVKTNNAKLTSEGLLDEGLPVFYVGDTRNNKTVDTLNQKLKDLQEQRGKNLITSKEYKEQKRKYELAKSIEMGKVTLEDMEQDPVKALERFSEMAFEFESMSKIENTMLTLLQTLKDTKMANKDPNGKIVAGEKKSLEESNAYRKGLEYMMLNYYQNDPSSASKAGQVVQRMMNLTSMSGVAFNIVGQISNLVTARTSANTLALSGRWFSKGAYWRARKQYATDYLANRFRATSKDYYKGHQARSLYEALVDHFQMFVNPNADAGRVDLLSLGYAGHEGAEYMVQTETGMAYIMDQDVKHKVTGATKKLRDIYSFDPNSGKLTQDPNYEFTTTDRQNTIDTIRSINKLTQGNYAREDRVMLQKYWLGNAIMQFHKHIPTNIKARFGKHYVHPDLGDIEGRYRTIAVFYSKLKEFEGSFMSRWNSAIQDMRPDQIANLKHDLADATYIVLLLAAYQVLSMIAAGIDDDDEKLKQLVNYLKWQDSRLGFEMATFVPILGVTEQWQQIKGPVPALRTIKDYMDVLKETALVPTYIWDGAREFKSGPHRGDMKLTKEWIDIIPALNNINRINNFEQVNQMYIR